LNISAIFSDYDGTLAPEDVAIETSSMSKEIEGPIVRLSSSVPVAIVTAKDFGFIRPRAPFARAWACVSGLEIVLSDGRAFASPHTDGRLREGLQYARRRSELGLTLELKRSTTKDLLGFSMDWRRTAAPPAGFVATTMADLTNMGLTAVYDPAKPYLDVFGARPDKGRAVLELKRLLGVTGKVLFLGDSTADNSAFEEADVGICVSHGQSLDGISCGFVLKQEELGRFLRSLEDDHLSLNLRNLTRK
jgi:HAD superfamily hydrolase (TIGR01484 family)